MEVLATFEDRKKIINDEKHRPLPVALRINSESRKETLKHYCVLWRPATFGRAPHALEYPFCFSPTRDTAYIVNRSLDPRWSRAWLKHFETQAPVMFAKIRSLEIRDWIWGSLVRKNMVRALQSRSGMDIGYFDPILLFQNLSKITLLRSRCSGEDPGEKEEIQECVGRFLEYHKDVWNGLPPKVEVDGWRQIKSRWGCPLGTRTRIMNLRNEIEKIDLGSMGMEQSYVSKILDNVLNSETAKFPLGLYLEHSFNPIRHGNKDCSSSSKKAACPSSLG